MPDRAQIARVCCAIAGTAAVPLLWWMGLVGGGKYDEHVANWTIQFVPTEQGVGVSESIEMDFGNEHRTGIDRTISNALGAPTSVSGLPWSPAPDELPLPGSTMSMIFSKLPIRSTGDATVARLEHGGGLLSDRHTLVAFYTLSTALGPGDDFQYEVIGAGRSVGADNVVVYIDGVGLDSPTCRRGSQLPCELERTTEGYEVHVSSLPAGDSLTIGGTITAARPETDRSLSIRSDPRERLDAGWVLLGLSITAAVVGWYASLWRWRRRCAAAWSRPSAPDVRAGDAANGLAGLPTFSSWKSSALVHHELGLSSAAAWFAEQVANGVLTLETVKGTLMLRRGPHFDEAGLGMPEELHRLFGRNDCVALDPNERRTKRAIRVVRDRQAAALQEHRWWRRFAPRGGDWFSAEVAAVFVAWAAVLAVLIATNWSYSWPVAIALLIVVPASTNAAVAWWMAPQLGLEGEDAVVALAPLRRMLRNADTSHVEAAHQAGLLPQYSAWAVALDAANRWRDAVLAADLSGDDAATALAPLEMGRNGGPWSLAADFPSNELRPPLRPQPADA